MVIGCSSTLVQLAGPPQTSKDKVTADIRECMGQAHAAVRLGLGALDPADRVLLEGRPTGKFFMHGRPVVTRRGYPGPHTSLLPHPNTEFTDQYVVCLLKKGYRWQEPAQ
jgi:hypothetical protein